MNAETISQRQATVK